MQMMRSKVWMAPTLGAAEFVWNVQLARSDLSRGLVVVAWGLGEGEDATLTPMTDAMGVASEATTHMTVVREEVAVGVGPGAGHAVETAHTVIVQALVTGPGLVLIGILDPDPGINDFLDAAQCVIPSSS